MNKNYKLTRNFDKFLAVLVATLLSFSSAPSKATKTEQSTEQPAKQSKIFVKNNEKDKSKFLTAALLLSVCAIGFTKVIKSKQLHLDPTTRPDNRADIWFEKLGGAQKDIEDFSKPENSLPDEKYKKNLKAIEDDLARPEESILKVIQEINGGHEAVKEIMNRSARNIEFRQGSDRFAFLLIYVFAESGTESNQYRITDERKAKAFFVYNKIVKIAEKALEKTITTQSHYSPEQLSLLSSQVMTFLVGVWGLEYAILFWDQIISKIDTYNCEEEKTKYILDNLFSAANFYLKVTRLTVKDVQQINELKNVTVENTKTYKKILGQSFY
ncbi:MAG: hypothetical protein LBJ32_03205 [Oscillospiraceae bacterium]|jgi:hypothetical protein|nr:hypothetical protein [Oscillospiraceae bacterium]